MTAPVSSASDEQPTEATADPLEQDDSPPEEAATPVPVVPDRADAPVSEVAERFLRAVIAEVPLERLEELHLFSPLRQGAVETGIAVLAARIPVEMAAPEADGDPSDDHGLFEGDDAERVSQEPEALEVDSVSALRPERLTVYTARYRYVIKGPERGKWESSVKAEADAPLVTVETVVRGVQRRAGEDSEIVRYGAAQIAHALRVPFPA